MRPQSADVRNCPSNALTAVTATENKEMDAMSFPLERYETRAGRIVGVTATAHGTLLTVVLAPGQELPAPARDAWIGRPVELLVFTQDPAKAPLRG
jgi:hypothetical protein